MKAYQITISMLVLSVQIAANQLMITAMVNKNLAKAKAATKISSTQVSGQYAMNSVTNRSVLK